MRTLEASGFSVDWISEHDLFGGFQSSGPGAVISAKWKRLFRIRRDVAGQVEALELSKLENGPAKQLFYGKGTGRSLDWLAREIIKRDAEV